jgi:hypothetical protein
MPWFRHQADESVYSVHGTQKTIGNVKNNAPELLA